MKNTIKAKRAPFTQISNALLNSKELSFKAKGLYSYMYSKPDNWTFTILSMAKQAKEGKDAILAALNELKLAGWVFYQRNSDGTGVYHIEYEPQTENPNVAIKPTTGKPACGKPACGKPARISNKDLINKTKPNNNIFLKEKFLDFGLFQKAFINDDWLRELCKLYNLSHDQLKIALNAFLIQRRAMRDFSDKTLKEHQAHFVRIIEKIPKETGPRKTLPFERYTKDQVAAAKQKDPLTVFYCVRLFNKASFILEEDYRKHNQEYKFIKAG